MSVGSSGSGGISAFTAQNDKLFHKLKEQQIMKEMNHMDQIKYKIEEEGDFGQV
jgi:hypothetical protein